MVISQAQHTQQHGSFHQQHLGWAWWWNCYREIRRCLLKEIMMERDYEITEDYDEDWRLLFTSQAQTKQYTGLDQQQLGWA